MDSPPTVYPDYYLLPIPITIFFYLISVLIMNKTFSYISGFLTAIAICKGTLIWETFSELPTRNQVYWLFWIALFFLLSFLGFLGMKKHNNKNEMPVTTLEYFERFQAFVMPKEEAWVKAVANASILLLSACAFYAFMPTVNHQSPLNIPIFILALTSLINIFLQHFSLFQLTFL